MTCNLSHVIGRTRWVCVHPKSHASGRHYFVKAVA